MNDDQLQALLRSLSHDLSGFARASIGFSQILLDSGKALDEQARKWLSLIVDQGNHAQTILSRLSVYARLFNSAPVLEACDLAELSQQAADESPVVQEAILAGLVTIERSGVLPTVTGVADHWKMVFIELIENSIIHNEGAVACEISGGPDHMTFSDNGSGVDSKYFDTIAKPLVKLTRLPLAGFGLSICAKIAEDSDGRLSFSTNEKGGLSVLFSWR